MICHDYLSTAAVPIITTLPALKMALPQCEPPPPHPPPPSSRAYFHMTIINACSHHVIALLHAYYAIIKWKWKNNNKRKQSVMMITQCQCLLWNYVPLADGIRSCSYHFNRCIIITTSSSIMLNRARHFLPLVCLQMKLNSLKVTRRVPRTASWLAGCLVGWLLYKRPWGTQREGVVQHFNFDVEVHLQTFPDAAAAEDQGHSP